MRWRRLTSMIACLLVRRSAHAGVTQKATARGEGERAGGRLLGVGLIVRRRESTTSMRSRQPHHAPAASLRPASTSSRVTRRPAASAPRRGRVQPAGYVRTRRGEEFRRPSRLDRPPAQIVAQVASGVAASRDVHAGAARAARSNLAVCGTEHHGVGAARSIPSAPVAMPGIGNSVVTALRRAFRPGHARGDRPGRTSGARRGRCRATVGQFTIDRVVGRQ